jgi:hypothetical protein
MALHWDGDAAWEQTDSEDSQPPSIEGPGTRYGVFRPDARYDLRVWSGPEETLIGVMGADLRSMKRAKQLGVFPTMKEVREIADAFTRWAQQLERHMK